MPKLLKAMLATLLAGVLAASPAISAEPPETEPSSAAMTFVGGFSDDHLSGMLSRIGARQPAMMAAGQANGGLLEKIFNLHIDAAVREHGPTWQRNMALAWTGLMTDEELLSLATAGAQSPYTDRYLELRNTAGQAMGALSQDLFQDILAEVVQNTLKDMGAGQETQTQ